MNTAEMIIGAKRHINQSVKTLLKHNIKYEGEKNREQLLQSKSCNYISSFEDIVADRTHYNKQTLTEDNESPVL